MCEEHGGGGKARERGEEKQTVMEEEKPKCLAAMGMTTMVMTKVTCSILCSSRVQQNVSNKQTKIGGCYN